MVGPHWAPALSLAALRSLGHGNKTDVYLSICSGRIRVCSWRAPFEALVVSRPCPRLAAPEPEPQGGPIPGHS